MRVAAVDCGTNSIRLLVADVDGVDGPPVPVEVDRRMRIVRLGEGVDATGRLSQAALDRTWDACDEIARVLADLRPRSVRFIATSASRDAENAAVFIAGVRERLGVEPEVVSGQEEARLSFAGALAGLAAQRPPEPVLVLDIGGGSTEFALGSVDRGSARSAAGRPDPAGISLNIGSVRLTERSLSGDPPTAGQVAATTALIDAALDDAERAVGISTGRTLVGLAGSVTSVGAAVLGLHAYDREKIHHARLPAARVHEVTGWLLGMTRADRSTLEWLHPGRVDVIGAGALVLDRVLQRLGPTLAAPEVIVSEQDILDGIVLSQV